jgi:immune inhibitor A
LDVRFGAGFWSGIAAQSWMKEKLMSRKYRLFSIALVLAMAFLGLAPVISAQGPSGIALNGLVPPRPDLASKLQSAPTTAGGLGLAADADAAQVTAAYNDYLAQKLDAKARPVVAAPDKEADSNSRSLAAAPPQEKAVVVLAQYSNLARNQIPKPPAFNNTDYWVQDFSRTHYETMLFSTASAYSLRNYFREASDYGPSPTGFDLNGMVRPWATLPGTAASYGNDAAGGVDNDLVDGRSIEQLVTDAAATLSGWAPTWADYSSAAGPRYEIDYLVVVHAGTGQESGGGAVGKPDAGTNAIWSVQGTLSSTYQIPTSSFDVRNYIVVSEDTPVGVLAHMFGHLFGLPDTWNPESGVDEVAWPDQDLGGQGEASPAFYDTMGQGCWLGRPLGTRPASMTAWARMELGWLSPAVWDLGTLPASIYLAQLESPSPADKALKIELPARTYVTPHSGDWMRQAPNRNNMASPSTLKRTINVTGTYQIDLSFWQVYDLEQNFDYGYVQVDAGDDGGWTTVYTVTGQQANPIQGLVSDWNPVTVSLRNLGLSGATGLRFRVERDNAIEGLGWFLDDLRIVQNGVQTWSDDIEAPPAGWSATRFPRENAFTSEHYYLAEWRNDDAGFDRGLAEAYNWTNQANGTAEYFRYNPGLLIWYVNPIYGMGDNNVLYHPGEGFALAIDSHPDPLLQDSTATPWRTRVQMQDATFRAPGKSTIQNLLTDSGALVNTIGPLPATSFFWDRYASYPYWDPIAADNSAKTLQYGVKLEVEGENIDKTGATVRFSIDAANMENSAKFVDKPVADPGEVLLYTIVLTNTGIADAHTVRVVDLAPEHTTYVSDSFKINGVTPANIDDYQTPDGIDWMGTVSLTENVTLTLEVELDPVIDDGTIITNVAHIFEGTVPEVDRYAYTEVDSEPCIAAFKTTEQSDVLAGGIITYTISMQNSGDMDAMAVLTDCIPMCTMFMPGSLSSNVGIATFVADAPNCANGGQGMISWTGPITVSDPVATTAVVTFAVKVLPGERPCTSIVNQGVVWDGHSREEPFWVSSKVLPGANFMDSTKTVDKAVAAPGDTLNYTITVFNSGNRTATVYVGDSIPVDTTYISPSLAYTGGTAVLSYAGPVVTGFNWNKSMLAGEIQTITFSVMITSPLDNGTWITNTANIDPIGAPGHARSAYTLVESRPILDPADGSNSNKTAAVDPLGKVITYTIRLCNIGTQDTTVDVVDSIPVGTEYKGPLAWTPGAGSGSLVGGSPDQVQWAGTVMARECITITFPVTITMVGTGVITNVAEVTDNVMGETFYLTTTTSVAGLSLVTPTQTIYCGDLVRIPVRVDNVEDLQGFQVTVDFDPAVLHVEKITEGGWFSPAGWSIKSYDNVSGTSTVVAELISSVGKTGSGILYYLDFRSVGPAASSPLTITYSLMANTPAPSFTAIPHNVTNCSVTVNGRSIVGRVFLQGRTDHTGAEIYINNIKLAETAADGSFAVCPPVGFGGSMTIKAVHFGYLTAQQSRVLNVTGTVTLNDTTLLGGDPIGPQIWVTSPLTCTTPITVPVKVAGPPDAKVNVLDLTFVGARFGKMSGGPDWNWPYDPCTPTKVDYKADINQDTIVNIFDLVLVGNNFGRTGPTIWP